MAEGDDEFRDLLNPIKDEENAFGVDVAQILDSFVQNFNEGEAPPNFNSAALVIQGSSSVYGKKVEYLRNLVHNLNDSLVKNKMEMQAKKESNKIKEKQKEEQFNDPFFVPEIKPGKNLSCLRQKNRGCRTRKNIFKKPTFVPVDLLPFEGEEKGDLFYDTNLDVVGNKDDYILNKCKISPSGWVLLPSISADLVPTEDSPPDYPDEGIVMGTQALSEAQDAPGVPLSQGSVTSTTQKTLPQASSDVMPSQQSSAPSSSQQSSAPSSSQQSSAPSSSQQSSVPSSSQQSSVPTSSEPWSEPMEDDEAGEDIPIDQIVEDLDMPALSVRRSMRQAQKSQMDAENQIPKDDVIVAVKKPIQKKNTCKLPTKMKCKENRIEKEEDIFGFCTRILHHAFVKKGFLNFGTGAFKTNTELFKVLVDRIQELKAGCRKNEKSSEDDDDDEDKFEVETLEEPDPDDLIAVDNIEAGDIVRNDPDEIPIPDEDFPSGDITKNKRRKSKINPNSESGLEAAVGELSDVNQAVGGYDINPEASNRVIAFESGLDRFLAELDNREEFDINVYGSRILDSFDRGERERPTLTFREICEGMEQWKVRRYFMALLPLANMGNIFLETRKIGEKEEIFITLISRRMHNLALEDFHL